MCRTTESIFSQWHWELLTPLSVTSHIITGLKSAFPCLVSSICWADQEVTLISTVRRCSNIYSQLKHAASFRTKCGQSCQEWRRNLQRGTLHGSEMSERQDTLGCVMQEFTGNLGSMQKSGGFHAGGSSAEMLTEAQKMKGRLMALSHYSCV